MDVLAIGCGRVGTTVGVIAAVLLVSAIVALIRHQRAPAWILLALAVVLGAGAAILAC